MYKNLLFLDVDYHIIDLMKGKAVLKKMLIFSFNKKEEEFR